MKSNKKIIKKPFLPKTILGHLLEEKKVKFTLSAKEVGEIIDQAYILGKTPKSERPIAGKALLLMKIYNQHLKKNKRK